MADSQVLASKAARVAAMVSADPPAPNAPEPAAAEPVEAEVPNETAAETTTAPAETIAPDAETAARALRKSLGEERLSALREKRQAERIAQRVLAEREAAAADRKIAADERAKWESARKDFKTGLANLGMNPREVYEEMTKQAIEADTPEAKIKQMQAAWKAELDETVAPLKGEIEQLRAERVRLAKQANDAAIVSAFNSEIAAPDYRDLRIEYGDDGIFAHVERFAEDPESFYPIAEKYNVQLREPGGRFSMKEVLQVLKAAQDAHERGREPRRARLAPETTQSPADTQSAQPALTVNGTAARSNAALTITNDLASSRASSGPTRLNRKQRVQALIDKDGRR